MGFRTLIINKGCKLSFKDNYLQILGDTINFIHLSEINSIIIENMQTTITSVLLSELSKNKIKVVFCDEKHNPYGEIVSYYNNYNNPKTIYNQVHWDDKIKEEVSDKLIKQKIKNQAKLLNKYGYVNQANIIYNYLGLYEQGDPKNKEGSAAKIYFNALFGKLFSRNSNCCINSKLNYGYIILLSAINRLVVNYGYLTQFGINHKNEFNYFNFSCDIIEPFRCIIDDFVLSHMEQGFDDEFKHEIVSIFERQFFIGGKHQYLNNALAISIKSIIKSLEMQDIKYMELYDYEL